MESLSRRIACKKVFLMIGSIFLLLGSSHLLLCANCCQYPVRAGCYVIHHCRPADLVQGFALGLTPIAGSDQHTFLHPGIPPAFQIAQFIPDQIALSQIHSKLIPGIEKELRRWFATAAWHFRRFGRNVDFFKMYTLTAKFLLEPQVHFLHFSQGEIAPPNTRLIGDNEQLKTSTTEPLQGGTGPRQDHHIFRAAQEIFVLDESPIAIQEDGSLHESPVSSA